MDHMLHDRDDGLAHCKVCHGAECSLPTRCPGRAMTPEEQDAVCAGRLQYTDAGWGVNVQQIIFALERQRRMLTDHGNKLADNRDYSAELLLEDADRIAEAITLLRGMS